MRYHEPSNALRQQVTQAIRLYFLSHPPLGSPPADARAITAPFAPVSSPIPHRKASRTRQLGQIHAAERPATRLSGGFSARKWLQSSREACALRLWAERSRPDTGISPQLRTCSQSHDGTNCAQLVHLK